ncbi:aminoglycoside phosphotransferase APH(3') [Paenibacillus sp. J31TS4]|uniref:aminoglycoside 3'-phosphotransferase n=1 Tax=Paenibacillus sp. J31TS4 TaxID=2807195 RepID=UPI001B27BC5A|nr:aminoglycoside 3'-phosphotransferase [Paenibacillus sp. J31TS4]GIP36911.1 aminoglycoside phosphotransferase APH(3') [Paenibacillus sp. J31TS4]
MQRTLVSFDTSAVPSSLQSFLREAVFYDSSCSEDARTYLVKGSTDAYLKIQQAGMLERESRMTEFLHGHRLAPRVLGYASDGQSDYLLTEAVQGEDGTFAEHLAEPVRLARTFGESLRRLHSLSPAGCPFPNRTEELLAAAYAKTGLASFRDGEPCSSHEVVLHGDYCLPNIIMQNGAFQAFIDLGSGGVGDRHYDLYLGIWTLSYNLKTDRYRDEFLDAYGRLDVDLERLTLFEQVVELGERG